VLLSDLSAMWCPRDPSPPLVKSAGLRDGDGAG